MLCDTCAATDDGKGVITHQPDCLRGQLEDERAAHAETKAKFKEAIGGFFHKLAGIGIDAAQIIGSGAEPGVPQ